MLLQLCYIINLLLISLKWFVVLYAVLVSLVYYALTIIPIAGGIISIIIGLTGFGFIVLWLYNIRKTNKISDGKESDKKKLKKLLKRIPNKSDKTDKNNKSDKVKNISINLEIFFVIYKDFR